MNQETSAAAEPPERKDAEAPSAADPALSPDLSPSEAETPAPGSAPEAATLPIAAAAAPHPIAADVSPAAATPMTSSEAQTPEPVPTEPATGDATPPPPARPARASSGMPSWLPLAALAIVPALLVGIIVYAIAGGDSGSSKSVGGVLDFFFRQGSSPENVESYSGQIPPNFPDDFPLYGGAETYAGFQVLPEQGNGVSFYVIQSTSDSVDSVYDWYLKAFNGDTWAVEIARASAEFTGLRFTRPDDPDVGGDVTLHRSELDKRSTIFITYQDLTPPSGIVPSDTNFVLPQSRALPAGFPESDIPVYDSNRGETVITETYIEKAPGGTSYIISFLTRDSQDDVIEFYREAFEDKGWTVEDADNDTGSNSFQLGITFTDGPQQGVQGTILSDTFEDDTSYTKVDVLVQVASGRNRGN